MAMVKSFTVPCAHTASISCVEYLSYKREYVTGDEDGVMKFWEGDTGKSVGSVIAHNGHITAFTIWSEAKLLLSAGLDSKVKLWTPLLECHQTLLIEAPVYSLAWHVRTDNLIVGVTACIRIFSEAKGVSLVGKYLNEKADYELQEHPNMVTRLCTIEGRVYSSGFDNSIVAYETYSERGMELIRMATRKRSAHTCAIPFLTTGQDSLGNIWVISGSFDLVVKIWSADLNPIYTLGPHLRELRGVCMSHSCGQLWVVQDAAKAAIIYDPKSGENQSDALVTYEEMMANDFGIMKLFSWKDSGTIIGTTRKRGLICWRYDNGAPILINRVDEQQDALVYTCKIPILIFSGGVSGDLVKWEKQQLTSLSFNTEILAYHDARAAVRMTEDEIFAREEARRLERGDNAGDSSEIEKIVSVNRLVFVESCDYLISGCEDGNVYIWGFDETHRKAQVEMEERERLTPHHNTALKFMSMSQVMSPDLLRQQSSPADEDSAGNRVAGFDCLHTLCYHTSAITALAAVRQDGNKFPLLLTSGWDRRIVLWNMQTCNIVDQLRPPAAMGGKGADDIITDLAYSPEHKLFAYSSADKNAYIRKFSKDGRQMTLVATLVRHKCEVTAICWNKVTSNWVTGSDDHTVAVWSTRGESCVAVLQLNGSVGALAIDRTNGCILAGGENVFWVFNPHTFRQLRRCKGHCDRIKAILHIPELNQYVTSSWDKSLRLWNSYRGTIDLPLEEEPEVAKPPVSVTGNIPEVIIDDVDAAAAS